MKQSVAFLICCTVAAGKVFAQSPVTLAVTNAPGYAVPADFIGMSFETGTLPGSPLFNPTNTALITLFQNIGVKNLRMGGGTVDGPKAAVPGESDIDNLFAFVRSVGNLSVIYSLRLDDGNSLTDAATAGYIWTNHAAQLKCFAIGNEPDWKSQQSVDPAITNYASYLSQWGFFASTVTTFAPGASFAGPDTGANFSNGPPDTAAGAWQNNGTTWTTGLATTEKSSGMVSLITQHHYVADGSTSTNSPSNMLDAMLSPGWDTITNQTLYNVMGAPLLAAGYPYRLTEAEDCVGGITGASDTFAGALWALDFLHWWAAHNCEGVNFHNSRWRTNTVITVNNNPDKQLSVYPKGYGVKAFDVGGHGREEPVGLVNTNGLGLTGYALCDSTNLYITIVNKEHGAGARSAAVTIQPDGFALGNLATMALTAPGGNVTATNGVTLGGAAITNNAPWNGQWTTLGSVSGQFTITVPATSAMILKVSLATPTVRVSAGAVGNPLVNYTGTLQSSTNVAGPYQAVAGAASPYTVQATNVQRFFRASNNP